MSPRARSEPLVDRPLTLLRHKVNVILTFAFGGVYNVPGRIQEQHGLCWVSCWTGYHAGFATWDRDTLTRLVVGAHDQCCRLSIWPGGPGRLRLNFSLRDRRANHDDRQLPIMLGHPTIEEAVATFRQQDWCPDPPVPPTPRLTPEERATLQDACAALDSCPRCDNIETLPFEELVLRIRHLLDVVP